MWLINTHNLELKHFIQPPEYAILSHQWEKDEEEVTFQEMRAQAFRKSRGIATKIGYKKVRRCCAQAQRDGLDYAWIDTCCINKESSAELSESINSMFNWYRDATTCYAYLRDIQIANGKSEVMSSGWFTRGWTLQELIAPREVSFYDQDWKWIGTKLEMANEIAQRTSIDSSLLGGTVRLTRFPVARKMSWAAERKTTRDEDQAYCLMGIFDVNMPLLYGEGNKAFLRLQEEILRKDDDHTIFAWTLPYPSSGLLAPNPSLFDGQYECHRFSTKSRPFAMTNRGLSIRLQIEPWNATTYIAWLNCGTGEISPLGRLGIYLQRLLDDDQYTRVKVNGQSFYLQQDWFWLEDLRLRTMREIDIYVRHGSPTTRDAIYGFMIKDAEKAPSDELLHDAELSSEQEDRTKQGKFLSLPHGNWSNVFVARWENHKLLKCAVFGFDFDLNPVCIITHAFTKAVNKEIKGNEDVRLPEGTEHVVADELYRCDVRLRRGHNTTALRLIGHRFNGFLAEVTMQSSDLTERCGVSIMVWNESFDTGGYTIWHCSIKEKPSS